MFRRFIKLILIILWMGIIFSFSSDNGEVSTNKSNYFIIRSIETIIGRDLTEDEKDKWVTYLIVPVRKGAHFGVYFILGLLIICFCSEFIPISFKLFFISLCISYLYACSDELHQLLVPGRSGQIKDVILDTIGAFLGISLYCVIRKKVKTKCDNS